MASASSVIQICNQALGYLGEKRIFSTSDLSSPSNNLERACATYFDDALKAVLEAVGWNCALVREDLTESTSSSPAFDFDNRFDFPTDKNVLHLSEVWIDQTPVMNQVSGAYDYRVESDSIVTDGSEVSILFVHYPVRADEESESDFNTRLNTYFAGLNNSLRRALAHQLAEDMSVTLTENSSLITKLENRSERALSHAVHKNTTDNPIKRFACSHIIKVRWEY